MFQSRHQKPSLTDRKQSSLCLVGISSNRVPFPFLCKYMQDAAGSKSFYPLCTVQIASEATSFPHTSSSFSNPLNPGGVSKPLKFARNFLEHAGSLLFLLTREQRSWRTLMYIFLKKQLLNFLDFSDGLSCLAGVFFAYFLVFNKSFLTHTGNILWIFSCFLYLYLYSRLLPW